MLACDPTIQIFADHRNLSFVFHPIEIEPSLGRHKIVQGYCVSSFHTAQVHRPQPPSVSDFTRRICWTWRSGFNVEWVPWIFRLDWSTCCRTIVRGCMSVFLTHKNTGSKIPCTISLTLHGSKPNEALNVHYLLSVDNTEDQKCVLLVKHDLSSYCWLDLSPIADGSHSAKLLVCGAEQSIYYTWILDFWPRIPI